MPLLLCLSFGSSFSAGRSRVRFGFYGISLRIFVSDGVSFDPVTCNKLLAWSLSLETECWNAPISLGMTTSD